MSRVGKDEVDLALGVLDHQLVDADGVNCGKVDDLLLDLAAGEVQEILIGGNAWRSRGLLGRLFGRLAGQTRHLAWSEVDEVSSVVTLRRSASDLAVGKGDAESSWAARLVARVPGAELK